MTDATCLPLALGDFNDLNSAWQLAGFELPCSSAARHWHTTITGARVRSPEREKVVGRRTLTFGVGPENPETLSCT